MWLPAVGVAVLAVPVADVLSLVAADRNTQPLHRLTEQAARCQAELLKYPPADVDDARGRGEGGCVNTGVPH